MANGEYGLFEIYRADLLVGHTHAADCEHAIGIYILEARIEDEDYERELLRAVPISWESYKAKRDGEK